MVMCTIDPVGGDPVSLEGLAGLGFVAVESTESVDGGRFGPANCAIAEFRAHDAQLLERQLRKDVADRLRRLQLDASFDLFVQPLEPAAGAAFGEPRSVASTWRR
jgi:hypothetical protein